MMLETRPFDPARHLTSEEGISAYLTEALESDDPQLIAYALGDVARARDGMTILSQRTGIALETLDHLLGHGVNPDLETTLRVLSALGVKLSASVAA